MAVENATYIKDLDISQPDGSIDHVSEVDNHLRLIKEVLINSLGNFGKLDVSDIDLNSLQLLIDVGTQNHIVVNPTTALTEYSNGAGCIFVAAYDSTSTCYIKFSDLVEKEIVGIDGTSLSNQAIQAGGLYFVKYYNDKFYLLSSGNTNFNTNKINIKNSDGTNVSYINSNTTSLQILLNDILRLAITDTISQFKSSLQVTESTTLGKIYFGNGSGLLYWDGTTFNFNAPIKISGQSVGDIPSGTKMPFYQASAPIGWTQITDDSVNNRMMVLSSSTITTGGIHNPIIMDVVPSHIHNININTGTESNSHIHGLSPDGRALARQDSSGGVLAGTSHTPSPIDASYTGTQVSGTASDTHIHNVSGSTETNTSSSNWTPRYAYMIVCQKN